MTMQQHEYKNKLSYIYSIYAKSSFNVVSSNHIKYLRIGKAVIRDELKDIQIEEIDWSKLADIASEKDINVLLHPILYPFGSPSQFSQNSRSFSRLLDVKHKIGGFDVADSDKISPFSAEILNKLDLIMVPSNWARDAYINSGVKSPVEVLPHGITDEFLDNNTSITSNRDIINLRKRKEQGNILVLYFMLHSQYRKGADLVTEVMKRVQNKFNNVNLVFKSPGVIARECPGVNGIGIRDWMDINDMKLLYDTCDICICPSRGGGFELNALEAVSRGIPTLAPNGGCFLDYIDYLIPINLNDKKFQLFNRNPIHIGNGFEADIDDFEIKLTDVINNLEEYKIRFGKNSADVRNKLSWRNTAKILEGYLKKYEFID